MKNRLYLIFLTSFLAVGCQSSLTESATNAPIPSSTILPADAENTATTEGVLVGKRVAEINQMGYYNCVGIGLDGVANGAMQYSVKWAPDDNSCFAGKNFITIEKVLTGNGSFTEDRIVEAELAVYPEENGRSYTTVPLRVNGGPNQFYVVEYTGKSYENITGVQKLWLMNLETKKFEETPVPPNFSFVNPYQIEAE